MPPYPGIPIISTAIVASPALAAETIIAQVVVGSVADPSTTIELSGWAAFTVGTSGTACRLRIRRASLTGTVAVDTGATTQGVAAAGLDTLDVEGTDSPGEVASLVYVLTLQVTNGAAASTVSAVKIKAVPLN